MSAALTTVDGSAGEGDTVVSVSNLCVHGGQGDAGLAAERRLLERSASVLAQLADEVALATTQESCSDGDDPAWARLVEFCRDRLLPSLDRTDRVLYAAAAGAAETRLLVRSLRACHDDVRRHVGVLGEAVTPEQRCETAHALEAVFASCVRIEKSVLLPALTALPGVELSSLADDVSQLDKGKEIPVPDEFDVRGFPQHQRNPSVFRIYARLDAGESFVLVSNRDPRQLRHEFGLTFPGRFRWDYVEAGPVVWRIRITRHAVPG